MGKVFFFFLFHFLIFTFCCQQQTADKLYSFAVYCKLDLLCMSCVHVLSCYFCPLGAAVGPLLAGLISPTGWNNVFYMLITADILACLVSLIKVKKCV